MGQFENDQVFYGLVQVLHLENLKGFLVPADNRDHDFFKLLCYPGRGDSFGFEAVDLNLAALLLDEILLVLVVALLHVGKPLLVFGCHVLAGADRVAGHQDFLGREHVRIDQVVDVEVFDLVMLQVVEEGVPDYPAGGIVVHYTVKVERTLKVHLVLRSRQAQQHGAVGQGRGPGRFLQFVDEVFDIHHRGLAAQGDNGNVVLLLELGEIAEVAELLREGNDVAVDAHFLVGLVLVPDADILVGQDLEDLHHVADVVGELLVLVGVAGQRVRPGERGLDVHVPVGADQLVELLLAGGDALLHLPDQVAHELGDIDGVSRAGALGLETLYQPFLRLVVDEFVEMADTGFPEAFFKG